jgi:hypothetical protein
LFALIIETLEIEIPHPIPIKNMNNFNAIDESGKTGIDTPKAKATNTLA